MSLHLTKNQQHDASFPTTCQGNRMRDRSEATGRGGNTATTGRERGRAGNAKRDDRGRDPPGRDRA